MDPFQDRPSGSQSTLGHDRGEFHQKNSSEGRYAPQFKQKIVDHVLGKVSKESSQRIPHSYSSTAKTFNIHPTTISEWVQESRRQSTIKNLTSLRRGGGDETPQTDDSCEVETTLKNVMQHFRKMSSSEEQGREGFYSEVGLILDNHKHPSDAKSTHKCSWLLQWWDKVKKSVRMDGDNSLAPQGESSISGGSAFTQEDSSEKCTTVRIKVIKNLFYFMVKILPSSIIILHQLVRRKYCYFCQQFPGEN